MAARSDPDISRAPRQADGAWHPSGTPPIGVEGAAEPQRMPVRLAVPGDIDSLQELLLEVHAAFGEAPPAAPRRREALERALDGRSPLTFLVAADGASLLGMVSLVPVPTTLEAGEFVYLDDLYVTPRARGQGVATALLSEARRWAIERGAVEIRLAADAADEALWRLYRDAGFSRQPMSWMVLSLGRDWSGRRR